MGTPRQQEIVVPFCELLAIGDALTHHYWGFGQTNIGLLPDDWYNVSKFKNISIYIRHYHDQDMSFRLYIVYDAPMPVMQIASELVLPATVDIPKIVDLDIEKTGVARISLRTQYAVAPTLGAQTLTLFGVLK